MKAASVPAGTADNSCMATAADILNSNGKRKVPVRWAKHYRQLCLERERLTGRDFSGPATALVKLDDLGESASDESERSLSFVTATATQETIFEVLQALHRIERGTYGICGITGKPIDAERLKALPWARYSLEGQQELEKSGQGRRTSLPGLEPIHAQDLEGEEEEEEAE